jgi:hypothetical protein
MLLIACCTFQLPIASWKMWRTFGMGRDIIQPMRKEDGVDMLN